MFYEGAQLTPITLPNGKTAPYIPSNGLKEAVNVALLVQRPLLIMGEPGVGKTLLAKAIAHEWYGNNIEPHYFEWHIKSTSKAQDGLYRYDALRRLADVQLLRVSEAETDKKIDNTQLGLKIVISNIGKLRRSYSGIEKRARSILLID
ncbi:MAG: AAA family ATPase [Sphingobacteriales bacterium]|nr:AAA family ATPase [Sphingobacteriales bacterium]